MTTLRVIRPPVDDRLVTALEEWLAMAKRGDITGAVLLANMPGDNCAHRWAGNMPLSVAMVTWEHFKLRSLTALESP